MLIRRPRKRLLTTRDRDSVPTARLILRAAATTKGVAVRMEAVATSFANALVLGGDRGAAAAAVDDVAGGGVEPRLFASCCP